MSSVLLRSPQSVFPNPYNRYHARVDKVYPPKYNDDPKARDAHIDPTATSTLDDDPPHVISGDLKTPIAEIITRDDPALYYYWVYLTELERDKSHEKGKSTTKPTENDKKLVGSLIEVTCKKMRHVHRDMYVSQIYVLLYF